MPANQRHCRARRVLAKLRETCNRYNVMLIADEVMSGFGRVGECSAWHKVRPSKMRRIDDLARASRRAHVPLGAVVVNKRREPITLEDICWISGLTYSGHPLAARQA